MRCGREGEGGVAGKGSEMWCEVRWGRGVRCGVRCGGEGEGGVRSTKERRKEAEDGRTQVRYVRMCKLQMNNEGARGEGIETSKYVLH